MQLLVAPVPIKALPFMRICLFWIDTGNVVPLLWMLLITHTSLEGSKVLRYCAGSYCFSSHADLHSSTSRLYMSTASSILTSSHLMCDINSSMFNSSAGLSLFLGFSCGNSPDSPLFCNSSFLNCLYGRGLFSCLFLLASTSLSIQAANSVSDSWVGLTIICVYEPLAICLLSSPHALY